MILKAVKIKKKYIYMNIIAIFMIGSIFSLTLLKSFATQEVGTEKVEEKNILNG